MDPNVIWAGTDDGNVQVTRDGGKTWTNTVKAMTGLAPNAWINKVDASHFDAGTAYVSASHWQDGDYAPYFYKTADFGKTWTKITGGLPARGWSHVIREDPKVRDLLYAGTEFGLYASWNGGATWTSIRNNMPPVAVRDIAIHPRDNDVIVATHGRGIYILDDAAPLQHDRAGREERRVPVPDSAGHPLGRDASGHVPVERARLAGAEPAGGRVDQRLPEERAAGAGHDHDHRQGRQDRADAPPARRRRREPVRVEPAP